MENSINFFFLTIPNITQHDYHKIAKFIKLNNKSQLGKVSKKKKKVNGIFH